MSMKATIKRKWLEALRGEEYDQTTGFLCETDKDGNDSFCCLGVLADVMGATFSEPLDETRFNDDGDEDVAVTVSALPYQRDGDPDGRHHEKYSLPEWLTVDSGLGVELADELAQLNDAGSSFKEIAKRIERDA